MDPSKSQETEIPNSPDLNDVSWTHVLPTRGVLSSCLSSLKIRRRNQVSLAASLPNEVLLHIFRYIQRLHMDPTQVGLRPRDDMRTLPLVCKGWYGAATNVFYHVVEFPRVHSVIKFHRSLSTRPHLRKLVKILYFPGRIGQECPPKLYHKFVQIIAMIEDLEELHTMCQLYHSGTNEFWTCVLPIGLGNHSRLKGLHIFADKKHNTMFPSLIAHYFQNLESLSLHGLNIVTARNMEETPILPNLISLTIVMGGSGAEKLDNWLCRLPRLNKLTLRYVRLHGPPRVFRTGKITTLELHYWPTWGSTVVTWLSYMLNLRHLTLNYSTFRAFVDSSLVSPLTLETLAIKMRPVEDIGGEDVFEKFTASGSAQSLLQFTIQSCRHQSWVREHEKWLQKVFKPADGDIGDVKFIWDSSEKCRCQGEVMNAAATVFHPMTKWGWHRVRRFTSEDTRRMIEWEWPAMRKA